MKPRTGLEPRRSIRSNRTGELFALTAANLRNDQQSYREALNSSLRRQRMDVIREEVSTMTESYVPVCKLATLHFMLSFAAQNEWKIDHLDAIPAFLNPEIDREVHMELPDGIERLWAI
jgi:hypothetical protein